VLPIKAGIGELAASARVNPYERGKHMPHLQTVAQLAKVVNVPVPYFYCRDAELAEEILKFLALGKAEKSDCLLSWAGEYGLSRRSYRLPVGSLRRSAAPVVARTASDSIGSSCASRLMRVIARYQ